VIRRRRAFTGDSHKSLQGAGAGRGVATRHARPQRSRSPSQGNPPLFLRHHEPLQLAPRPRHDIIRDSPQDESFQEDCVLIDCGRGAAHRGEYATRRRLKNPFRPGQFLRCGHVNGDILQHWIANMWESGNFEITPGTPFPRGPGVPVAQLLRPTLLAPPSMRAGERTGRRCSGHPCAGRRSACNGRAMPPPTFKQICGPQSRVGPTPGGHQIPPTAAAVSRSRAAFGGIDGGPWI